MTRDRWEGIVRPWNSEDVERLSGSISLEHTLARMGARKLWQLFLTEPLVRALGAVTGNQAKQMVQAGLKAIYVSGWQAAADANTAGETYPDQGLYPADSVPRLVKRLNKALERADRIERSEGKDKSDWFVPLIADAEAGFGGPPNAFELMRWMIEAGASAVHYEDQLSSEKKCGHMGGKVLLAIPQFIKILLAARLAADIEGVPTIVIARTDARSAKLINSDIDERDREFFTGERTPEGHFYIKDGVGLQVAITRALAYAPYADLLWCETSTPNIEEARQFAEAVHAKFPGKFLAYNCSPSFNWKKNLDDATIAKFQNELGAMGYKFQFVTLAGFHSINHSMYELARDYSARGMSAYVRLQEAEFESAREGAYTAVRHQREVGTGYYDEITKMISGGESATTALTGSTEEQFK